LQKYLRPHNLLQITDDDEILWQKEALLNIGVQHLPEDCDKVCWVDCDVMFQQDDWVEQTSELLHSYMVVQPYSYGYRMPPGLTDIPAHTGDCDEIKGFIKEYVDRIYGQDAEYGHPGYACAFRKDVLLRIGGLLDTCVIGSGDMLIAKMVIEEQLNAKQEYSGTHSRMYYSWAEECQRYIRHSFAHVEGEVFHLYHGSRDARQHGTRLLKFRELDFDPTRDLTKKANGLYKLSKDGQAFKQWVKEFFVNREEDT